jgi:murein DD-endopeptidase MepM/ murein hydrolase activator NlpD
MIVRRVIAGLIAAFAIVTLVVPSAEAGDDVYLRFPQLDEHTEFVDSWGMARPDDRTHQGVDLMGAKMAPVVAVLDGVIETMREGDIGGYYIKIDHGQGTSSWYMHLNNDTPGTDDGRGGPEYAFAEGLRVGDPIEAGQMIGYVGDSGNAEGGGPHTHFELSLKERMVNPYPYLRGAHERWLLELAIERGETDFK